MSFFDKLKNVLFEYAQKIESQIEGAKVKVINLVSAVGIHTGLGCLALQVFNEMKD